MKLNGQNSSKPITPLIWAPCGPPYDQADKCAARGGFELESPAIRDL